MPSTISCLAEDVVGALALARAAEQLVQRQHRVVAGMIGVVAGRPVDGLALRVAHRVIVGDRDRFVVSDEEAELPTRGGRPGTHAGVGARLVEVDRRAAAGLVKAGVGRRPFLVRAPAEFGRLHALRQKSLDRPGVDEHVARLRMLCALRIALGDMHAPDAEGLSELAPVLARLRLGALVAQVSRQIDERLLDEPGDHAGIGAAAGDRGRSAGVLAPLLHHRFAQRVIGARFVAARLVVIEAGPGLDDGVDIERADLAAVAP